MNAGQILGFLWTLLAAFFLLSVLVAAIGFPRWRHREKQDQQQTEETLRLLKSDTTNDHFYD